MYKDVLFHIRELPVEQPPELFGFHPTANIAKDRREIRDMCLQLNRLGEVEGLKDESLQIKRNDQKKAKGAHDQTQELAESKCEEILAQIPSQPFNYKYIKHKFQVSISEPYNAVLVQEVQRYQPLIQLINQSINSVLLTIKGEEVASSETEKLVDALLIGEIPALWANRSYPTEKGLSSFIMDLRQRIQFLENWIDSGTTPHVFWLPGFYFPQSFLTATLQAYATKYSIAVNRLYH